MKTSQQLSAETKARREIEELLSELRTSEERYRLLVDMIPQNVWTTDARGRHRQAPAVGRIKKIQTLVGRIYHLLTKEAAYGPNLHHMDDFRAAQTLEKSLGEVVPRQHPRSSREPGVARESA